jgi:hypothetical protein
MMPTQDGKLKPTEVQMTEAEWEINKDCAAKKRDHKFYWKYDPATGLPSETIGKCAHCGLETEMNRDYHPEEK